MKILMQQGDSRFLIDAGKDPDGNALGRVYDLVLDTLSAPLVIGSLTAHSPGWVEPFAPPAILTLVESKASARRY